MITKKKIFQQQQQCAVHQKVTQNYIPITEKIISHYNRQIEFITDAISQVDTYIKIFHKN